jgi:glucokinase
MWRSGGTEKSAVDLMNEAEEGGAIALQTVESFIRVLGAVAGDLTLIHLPYGGVYFVGGVARAMKHYFERMRFREYFRDKGRFATFMDDFSVQIVEDDNAAMIGCAQFLKNSRKI